MTYEPFDLLRSPLTGTNLIEASAGTGKTFTIAGLVVRLVLEQDLPVTRILVVTFTVAATEELRDRVRRRLREALLAAEAGTTPDPFLAGLLQGQDPVAAAARLEAALREFDEAPIFTIHGFCQRVLREHAFEGGLLFDTELVTDQGALFQEVADDWWRRELCAGPADLAAFARAGGVTADGLKRLLQSFSTHPTLEVLPPVGPGDLDARRRAFGEALGRARAAWAGAEEEVRRLLTEHDGLRRSQETFGPAPLRACLDGLARYAGSATSPACFCALRKVAARNLEGPEVLKKGKAAPEHLFFDLCQELCETGDALLLALRSGFLASAREELARKKLARNVQGFDDLLATLHRALRGPGGASLARALREKYSAALIDEFQDTDPLQYEIFGAAFGSGAPEPSRLFLIGDPKQAIYGFRGADVFAYLEAARSAGRTYTLGQNWRSEPPLVRGVSALFRGHGAPFVFPEIHFPAVEAAERADRADLSLEGDDDPPLRVWFVDRTGDNTHQGRIAKGWAQAALPRAVAGEIGRLLRLGLEGKARLGHRPLEPGDVAVLVRTNRQASLVQEALRSLGVPSVLYSTGSLFDSREALEVERVLLALAEPRDEGLLRAALSTDLLGADGDELHRLGEDEGAWEAWAAELRDLHELWGRKGFLPLFRHLLASRGVRERLLAFGDGERRLTNALHLAEVLHGAEQEEKLGPGGLGRWLARRRADGDAREECQLRLESDERAVKLVTVHRSKGLEYPVVFCPFAWEGSELRDDEPGLKVHLAGDGPGGGRFVLDLGSDGYAEHARLAEVELLAENLRLFYVSLTRARSRCTVVWGAFKSAETSAPAYLLHHRDGALGAGRLADLGDRVKGLSDGDLRAALAPFETRGVVAVEPLPEARPEAWTAAEGHPAEPRARSFGGRIAGDWRTASFTSLVSGAPADDELPDHDAGSGATPETVAPTAGHLLAFPAGARAGTCLHEILERADLGADGGPSTPELVARHLRAHGFGPEWQGAVERMVSDVAATPLDPGLPGFALGRVPRSERLHEVEFTLPLRQEAGALTPAALARAFGGAGSAELAAAVGADGRSSPIPGGPGTGPSLAGVPERLGRLEFSPVRGYLRGFVDLVFRFGDRWFLADWKSNRLGERPEDYGPEALAACMAREHYILQYHLYAAALHRHLATRLPGYDYERHFGGVFYVFLRGLDPKRPGRGVFRDRPPWARVEALAALLAGEDRGQP